MFFLFLGGSVGAWGESHLNLIPCSEIQCARHVSSSRPFKTLVIISQSSLLRIELPTYRLVEQNFRLRVCLFWETHTNFTLLSRFVMMYRFELPKQLKVEI